MTRRAPLQVGRSRKRQGHPARPSSTPFAHAKRGQEACVRALPLSHPLCPSLHAQRSKLQQPAACLYTHCTQSICSAHRGRPWGLCPHLLRASHLHACGTPRPPPLHHHHQVYSHAECGSCCSRCSPKQRLSLLAPQTGRPLVLLLPHNSPRRPSSLDQPPSPLLLLPPPQLLAPCMGGLPLLLTQVRETRRQKPTRVARALVGGATQVARILVQALQRVAGV